MHKMYEKVIRCGGVVYFFLYGDYRLRLFSFPTEAARGIGSLRSPAIILVRSQFYTMQ